MFPKLESTIAYSRAAPARPLDRRYALPFAASITVYKIMPCPSFNALPPPAEPGKTPVRVDPSLPSLWIYSELGFCHLYLQDRWARGNFTVTRRKI